MYVRTKYKSIQEEILKKLYDSAIWDKITKETFHYSWTVSQFLPEFLTT